jgi:hypothetical protein
MIAIGSSRLAKLKLHPKFMVLVLVTFLRLQKSHLMQLHLSCFIIKTHSSTVSLNFVYKLPRVARLFGTMKKQPIHDFLMLPCSVSRMLVYALPFLLLIFILSLRFGDTWKKNSECLLLHRPSEALQLEQLEDKAVDHAI